MDALERMRLDDEYSMQRREAVAELRRRLGQGPTATALREANLLPTEANIAELGFQSDIDSLDPELRAEVERIAEALADSNRPE